MTEILTAGPVQRAWYELVNSTTMQTVDAAYANDFDAVLVAFHAQ
jgi:hypothetical protein